MLEATSLNAFSESGRKEDVYLSAIATLKKSQESQKLSDEKYNSWLTKLSGILNDKAAGDASKAKAVYDWVSELDTDQFNAFIQMYPELAAGIEALYNAGKNGSAAATNITEFAGAVSAAANTMIQALNEYKQTKQSITDEEGNGLIQSLAGNTNKYTNAPMGYMNEFSKLTEEQQTYLINNSEAVRRYVEAYKSGNVKEMTSALAEFEAEANAIDLTKLTAQIENVGKNGDTTAQELQSAYTTLYDYADKWYEAQTELGTIQKKLVSGEDVLYSDVSQIASFLNMSPEAVLANWESVPDLMAQNVEKAKNLMQALNDAYAASVLGMTTDTFESIKNGTIIVDDLTEEARALLVLSGQWKVAQKEVTGKASFADGKGG